MLNRLMGKMRSRRADLLICALFVLLAVLCHGRYVFDPELLFATEGDSFRQILPTSILYQNALAEGDPFWSWSFGLGGDMLTELSYAGTTSIFTYLQFFVRALFGAAGGGTLLSALRWKLLFSVIKQSLALVLMYALLRYEKQRSAFAFVGAVAYGLAPWFLYRAILFDFMTDAYALLPLAMLAFSRYRRTGRWIALTMSIALLIGTNLYFGYIGCIFLASVFLLFSAARIGGKPGGASPDGWYRPLTPGVRAYTLRLGKLLAVSVAGALLCAVALLPSANAILSSDRTVANAQLTLLAHADTLENLFTTLLGSDGLFALPLLATLAFFLCWRTLGTETRKRTLLAALWLVLLLVPATSSVMNGFSYETPRWHFVVIFAVAYALPYWLDELTQGHAHIRVGAVVALCGALCGLYFALGDHVVSLTGLIHAASFCLALLALLWTAFYGRILKHPIGARIWTIVLCAAVATCGVLNSLGVRVHNLYAENAEEAFFGSEGVQAANAALVPDEGTFFRTHDMGVDTHDEDAENRPYVYGTYGVSNYASEVNGRLSRWLKTGLRFRTTPVCAGIYQSFDDRLFADIAWAVRYKVPDGETALDLPSYWTREQLENGSEAYACTLFTGFSLWYDTAISARDWLLAGTAQRDAMLLQTAALEGDAALFYPAPQLDEVTTVLLQTFTDAVVEGGSWTSEGLLRVPERATLCWSVPQMEEEGEYLVSFSIEEISGEEAFSVSAGGRTMDKFADTLASESLNYPLSDYAFRFAGTERTLSLTLTKGEYRLKDLQIAFNGYQALEEWVSARNRYDFDTLYVDGSRIDGTITVNETGVLALSMPMHDGWRCRVDGSPAELLTVNGIFAGIALSPGTHTVSMRYTPPYLLLGAAISLLSAAGLAVAVVVRKRKERLD